MREDRMRRHISAATSIAIGLVLGLGTLAAFAQQGGPPETIRALPAEANPPPDAVETERMEKEKIPEPPAKGQSKGRVLPAAAAPPPDIAAAEQAAKQEIPPPPGKANSEELLEKIRSRPGGGDRVEAAKQGKAPMKSQRRSGDSTSSVLETVGSFLMEQAEAGDTFTLDLTPEVTGSGGRHMGLYSSSPFGYAWARGAFVSYYYPSNSSIYLQASSFSQFASQISNPYVFSKVQIPADGWYIININSLLYAPNLNIHHYEGGSYVLLENMPKQSGWADYPTLQYLTEGTHYFYFVLTGSGHVSRVSYDSYP